MGIGLHFYFYTWFLVRKMPLEIVTVLMKDYEADCGGEDAVHNFYALSITLIESLGIHKTKKQ